MGIDLKNEGTWLINMTVKQQKRCDKRAKCSTSNSAEPQQIFQRRTRAQAGQQPRPWPIEESYTWRIILLIKRSWLWLEKVAYEKHTSFACFVSSWYWRMGTIEEIICETTVKPVASRLTRRWATQGDDEKGKRNLRKFEQKLAQPPSSYSPRSLWPTVPRGAGDYRLLW